MFIYIDLFYINDRKKKNNTDENIHQIFKDLQSKLDIQTLFFSLCCLDLYPFCINDTSLCTIQTQSFIQIHKSLKYRINQIILLID